MALSERDDKIISFLHTFKIANTSTIYNLFFYPRNPRGCTRRLKELYEYNFIGRSKEHIGKEYSFFIDSKPKNAKHELFLTDLYRELLIRGRQLEAEQEERNPNDVKKFLIHNFLKEPREFEIVPDGLITFEYDKMKFVNFIEVEISSNNINRLIEKYVKLKENKDLWQKYFPTFPRIVVVTNKKIPTVEELDIVSIHTSFKDIDKFFNI